MTHIGLTRIDALEAEMRDRIKAKNDEIEKLREQLVRAKSALTLAEDVLSRAPFSTGIWPNGIHPQRGIEQIRSALSDDPDAGLPTAQDVRGILAHPDE